MLQQWLVDCSSYRDIGGCERAMELAFSVSSFRANKVDLAEPCSVLIPVDPYTSGLVARGFFVVLTLSTPISRVQQT